MAHSRQLHLGAFMRPVSMHTGAWRYPGAIHDANFNFAALKRFAQKLEEGKFDAFFMADHLARIIHRVVDRASGFRFLVGGRRGASLPGMSRRSGMLRLAG